METLQEAILRAKKAHGCGAILRRIEKLKTWDKFWRHAKAPEWATWYALHVIEGRWPEAEPVILKSPQWAGFYARDVIKGRWPEAEPVILESPPWACWYDLHVIEGLWEKE